MIIIFAGDSPSRTNTSETQAFIGAKCWPRLKSWIWRLGLVPTDCILLNTHLKEQVDLIRLGSELGYKVVAVGSRAANRLSQAGIKHYRIDHPSGLNRNLNNKEYVDNMLGVCYKHLWS